MRKELDAAATGSEPFGVHCPELELEAPRKRDVVGIHPREQRCTGLRAGALHRCDHAERRLAHDVHARVAAGERFGDRGGAVR